jgi:hypothetical protein
MEDNTGMDLKETGGEDVDWIHLSQEMVQWKAFMNMVMNLRDPKKVECFLAS